jgi:hypothetical protein
VCARIFDENGDTVSGSILWWEANLWNPDGVGIDNIILRKNKTYYLEVASENVENTSSRTYDLSILESSDFMNTGIISPNGGCIMRPNSSIHTREDLNKSFNSRGNFVISTNSNYSSVDNPGLPFYSLLPNNLESGYWFDRWIGTKTWYSIYYQDSYS